MPDLNWNRNPEIRRAAAELKVFQNPPGNQILRDVFKELGIGERPRPKVKISSLRRRKRAKIVYYSEFLKRMITDEGREFLNAKG